MFYFRIDLSSKHGLGHYHRAKALIRLLNIKKYKIIVDKIPENIFFRNKKISMHSIVKIHFFTMKQMMQNYF